jgi:hypothetical protein
MSIENDLWPMMMYMYYYLWKLCYKNLHESDDMNRVYVWYMVIDASIFYLGKIK